MNEESYGGWLDQVAYEETLYEAMRGDSARIDADQKLTGLAADAAYDAGFVAGVEAQKQGLGEAA